MNLARHIARSYLFSRKNQSAINIISAISALLVTVATSMLIIILSVLNGFDELIQKSLNSLTPDYKITAVKGKTFNINNPKFNEIKTLDEINHFVEVLEENVLVRYMKKQGIAIIKGVSENYKNAYNPKDYIYSQSSETTPFVFDNATLGYELMYGLGISLNTEEKFTVWIPDRKKININNPESSFRTINLTPAASMSVEQEFDATYILASIEKIRTLTVRDSNTVSSIEIQLKDNVDFEITGKKIKDILGEDFNVKNSFEQNSDIHKVVTSEKTASFFILIFIVIIASFSLIASLTMLILEKKEDLKTLFSMGAEKSLLKKIFLYQGRYIAFIGSLAGILLGFLFVILQINLEIITLPEGEFIIDSYPVKLNAFDFLWTFLSVNLIGFLISYYPVSFIKKVIE